MAGSLLPQPKQSFLDSAANPLVGGKLYTYAAGTLTPKATYQDAALTIANTNPVVANARGEVVMYGNGTYRIILKDAAGNTIWDQDNVEAAASAISGAVSTLGASLAAGDGAALVGFQFAGGLARPVQDKLRDVVSVKDFGAKGDGVTDDTAAFAAAFAASKSVYAPAGTYLASINLPESAELRGDGCGFTPSAAVTKIVAPLGAAYAIQIDAAASRKTHCKIRNLSILNLKEDPASIGINLKGNSVNDFSDYHLFEDLAIRGFETSIKIRGRSIWSKWVRVYCSGGLTTTTGITTCHLDSSTDPSDVSFNQNSFHSCTFSGAKREGIKILGQNATNRFETCSIESNNASNVAGVAAAYVEDSRQIQFDGCYFESNGLGVPVDTVTISNNAIDLQFGGTATSTHYNPSVTNCWFYNGGICIWAGKNNNVLSNIFLRGGNIANNLLLPKTNGFAFYSSISRLHRSDAPLRLDSTNFFNGSVVILCDFNKSYPCIVQQSDSVAEFVLTSSIFTITPIHKNYVITPDGSGTDMEFTFLTAGMRFTIYNASPTYALVLNPAKFPYSNTPFRTNWTIPPQATREYMVVGVLGQTVEVREVGTPIKVTGSPPTKGYFSRGELIHNINLNPGGFVGYATVNQGGASSATRANSTAYALGDWVAFGSTVNECIAAGATSSAAPAAPTALGQVFADGTVTWKCRATSVASLKVYGAIGA